MRQPCSVVKIVRKSVDPISKIFFGDPNIVVMDVGNLCGRLIAAVWPDTKIISIRDPEVGISRSGFIS